MRDDFARKLVCLGCGGALTLDVRRRENGRILEGALRSSCGQSFPIIDGVPRLLPPEGAASLRTEHEGFFERHPDLTPHLKDTVRSESTRTQQAFGDEWRRFPELLAAHQRIFEWYFQGPGRLGWRGQRVLDAGCGMGRWLHFVLRAGADIVGMDVSAAIDVAAARDAKGGDFVQADLLEPPFAPDSFDLVYCFGVVHHLEDPLAGVRSLARLVCPGGELRLYVYRTLDDEPSWKRALFHAVTALRRVTTRLPYWAVHAVSWAIAVMASAFFLWPRRLMKRWPRGDRLTRNLPLVHYAEAPFKMLVSEQFDRLVAPIEGRFSREDVEGWLRDVGFEVVAVLPGLGWRAIGRRPV